ncbi:uncharacterized protein LOC122503706 [Leptopilina heterotoma]|uniref:uncharacterized protein LOC122503706 n=1 Tax=Leptopilina heterotoma TaxID=63436 RepID=UPI001CA84C6A|nr:uncharacterized protein LOC122503706 [Leptopilina heterotoma]
MASEHLSGNGYSPLPQSISNSDSEDEDDHLNGHNHSIHRDSDDMTMTESLHKNGQFHPLDETQNMGNRIRNGRSSLGFCNDNIPIMVLDGDGHDLWKRHDMSPVRRICLVFSILLCILTTLVFLYVLPCDNSKICSEALGPKTSLSWEKSLEGIELQGPISVLTGRPSNLIFLLRGQKYGNLNSQAAGLRTDGGGVLSMEGTTGVPLWWTYPKGPPTNINCLFLDAKDSKKLNCIVVGEQGLLENIDPITGYIRWISTNHTDSNLPLLLPDVNSDKVSDLLTVQFGIEPKIKLIIISGDTGKTLKSYPITNCESVKLHRLTSNFTVQYFCKSSNNQETLESIALDELLSNLSYGQRKYEPVSNYSFTNNAALGEIPNIWNLSPFYRLYVKNQGECPSEKCQVNVTITVHKQNDTRIIWSHFGSGSYASLPTVLNKTDEPLKSTGCVLKFWHWSTSNEKEAEDEFGLVKRTITERVLIILMSGSDFRAFNASQSDIIQLCKGDVCQPNLQSQIQSMAVVDLDNDGYSELISYRSSYEGLNSDILSSKVQVVKLDAVL